MNIYHKISINGLKLAFTFGVLITAHFNTAYATITEEPVDADTKISSSVTTSAHNSIIQIFANQNFVNDKIRSYFFTYKDEYDSSKNLNANLLPLVSEKLIQHSIKSKKNQEIQIAFERSDKFGSEWFMYDGNIFIEGVYRNQRYHKLLNTSSKAEDFNTFNTSVPWLRWDSKNKIYHLEKESGSQALANLILKKIITPNIELYRGLHYKEYQFLIYINLLKNISHTENLKLATLTLIHNFENYQSNESESLVSKFKEILTSLDSDYNAKKRAVDAKELLRIKYKKSESLFSTPTKNTASNFSQKYANDACVVKSVINTTILQDLVTKNILYAGMEYNYFELLFYGPDAAEEFIDGITFDENTAINFEKPCPKI